MIVILGILFVVMLIGGIVSFYLSADQFQLEIGVSHWKITAQISNYFSLFADIPFHILQSTTFAFHTKTAFLIFHFAKSIVTFAAIICVIYLVKKIVISFSENSPFTPQNVKRVQIIGYIIIGYFGLVDLLVSLCLNIFVMDNISIYLFGVFRPLGLGLGFLLLLLAKVFQYGVFLQNKEGVA